MKCISEHPAVTFEPNSGCWLWTGACNEHGYGRLTTGKRSFKAHRLAFSLSNGGIPSGAHILHKCDNPACVNPDHLFSGSHLDNMLDMNRKGRHGRAGPQGIKAHAAKLTDDGVVAVRASQKSHSALAKEYGVSYWTIRRARVGFSWRHVK